MKEQWLDNLRDRLGNHKVTAPDGLLDNIRQEMLLRGIAPTPKPTTKLGSSKVKGSSIIGAIIITSVIMAGYFLSNKDIKTQQQQEENIIKTEKNVQKDSPLVNSSEALVEETTPSKTAEISIQPTKELFIPSQETPFIAPINAKDDHTSMLDDLKEDPMPSPLPATAPVDQAPSQAKAAPIQWQTASIAVTPLAKEPSGAAPSFSFAFATNVASIIPSAELITNRQLKQQEDDQKNKSLDTKKDKDADVVDDANVYNSETYNLQPYHLASTRSTGFNNEDASSSPNNKETFETIVTQYDKPISLGFTVGIPLSQRISITTGLTYNFLYSTHKVSSPMKATSAKQKLHYMGIPLMINYKLLTVKGFEVYTTVGGEVKKLVFGETIESVINDKSEVGQRTFTTIKESKPQYSVNGALGISYYLWGGFNVYIEPGVTYHLDNHSDLMNYYKYKKTNFTLNTGLRYTLFKK